MEKAIVVDIDGTVALNDHREYHDYSDAVLLDKPIKPVINVVKMYYNAGYKLIFLTGRKVKCEAFTKQWIDKHIGVPEYILYMRDKRFQVVKDFPDYTMKEIIYNESIKPFFDIECVFEDRKSVKEMWVKNGLFVFDTNQMNEVF